MGKDEIFISHDVVSLFTKTPNMTNSTATPTKGQKPQEEHTFDSRPTRHSTRPTPFHRQTYFQFCTEIYRQKEGFAMGDPLSAIMCGFFMEHLEKEAITSAPEEYRPTLWKRYVDDMRTQELTAHLNSIDHTGNIKFTHEEEADRSIVLHGHKNPL